MNISGKCFCGYVTYTAEVDPDKVAICHCTDCQSNSGTAYGVVAGVIDGRFELLSGELKVIGKVAESGAERSLTFCPECGTRIYAKPAGDAEGFFGLRAGTIDQRDQLPPKFQVWCRSAQPWAIVDGIPRYDTQR